MNLARYSNPYSFLQLYQLLMWSVNYVYIIYLSSPLVIGHVFLHSKSHLGTAVLVCLTQSGERFPVTVFNSITCIVSPDFDPFGAQGSAFSSAPWTACGLSLRRDPKWADFHVVWRMEVEKEAQGFFLLWPRPSGDSSTECPATFVLIPASPAPVSLLLSRDARRLFILSISHSFAL